MSEHCGYAVTDNDGEQQPCGRPVTGWRWYQDVEHEDTLDTACEWHENEGGRRIATAEAVVERVRALADEWRRSDHRTWVSNCGEELAEALEGR